jgi:hypothetical protein
MNPFGDSLFVTFRPPIPDLTKDLQVRNKILVLLGILCLSSVGFAQEPPPARRNVELSGGYSSTRTMS